MINSQAPKLPKVLLNYLFSFTQNKDLLNIRLANKEFKGVAEKRFKDLIKNKICTIFPYLKDFVENEDMEAVNLKKLYDTHFLFWSEMVQQHLPSKTLLKKNLQLGFAGKLPDTFQSYFDKEKECLKFSLQSPQNLSETALEQALENDKVKVAKYAICVGNLALIKHIQEKFGLRLSLEALTLASMFGHITIVKFLLESNQNLTQEDKEKALYLAFHFKQPAVAELLMNTLGDQLDSGLAKKLFYLAVDDLPFFKLLLDKNVNQIPGCLLTDHIRKTVKNGDLATLKIILETIPHQITTIQYYSQRAEKNGHEPMVTFLNNLILLRQSNILPIQNELNNKKSKRG